MIIDAEGPDRPTRRWPFLVSWSLVAAAILGGFFLTRPSDLTKPTVRTPDRPAPAAIASGRPSAIFLDATPGSRGPRGGAGVLELPSYSIESGVITYRDYAGRWIAIGLQDDLRPADAPDPGSSLRR